MRTRPPHTGFPDFFLVPALTADIKRTERARVIEAFRKCELPVLVSCRVLNEGVDVPDADVAIILGGTAWDREHIQRVGRVLRPAEGNVGVVYCLLKRGSLGLRPGC